MTAFREEMENDWLFGNAGNDRIDGGAGNDGASYFLATKGVTVSLAIQVRAQNTLGDGSDTLVSIENIAGSKFGDKLTGSSLNNTIWAYGGNDIISGGAGNDWLLGGQGNDKRHRRRWH